MEWEALWEFPARVEMEGIEMKPVVGVDVAKGESQIQAFKGIGDPFGKSERIVHTLRKDSRG